MEIPVSYLMTGKNKGKSTYYLDQFTLKKLDGYIEINYASTYGAYSQTVNEALNYYIDSTDSVKPYQSEKFIKPKEGTT